MRAAVFLLILANLLFWAWMQGFFAVAPEPDALRAEQQVAPDRVRIVSRDEPPPAAARPERSEPRAGEAKPEEARPEAGTARPEENRPLENRTGAARPAEVCVHYAELVPADADRIEALLAAKWPAARAVRAGNAPVTGYWVFIPPLAGKADADRKAGELKRLKVPEFYVVQDDGPNRFAISLGLFSTRAAAEERMESLRRLGVRSAKVGERSGKPSAASLDVTVAEGQAADLRRDVSAALPGAKPAACAAPAAAT